MSVPPQPYTDGYNAGIETLKNKLGANLFTANIEEPELSKIKNTLITIDKSTLISSIAELQSKMATYNANTDVSSADKLFYTLGITKVFKYVMVLSVYKLGMSSSERNAKSILSGLNTIQELLQTEGLSQDLKTEIETLQNKLGVVKSSLEAKDKEYTEAIGLLTKMSTYENEIVNQLPKVQVQAHGTQSGN